MPELDVKKHRKEINERQRAYRIKNRKRILERIKAYRKKNRKRIIRDKKNIIKNIEKGSAKE